MWYRSPIKSDSSQLVSRYVKINFHAQQYLRPYIHASQTSTCSGLPTAGLATQQVTFGQSKRCKATEEPSRRCLSITCNSLHRIGAANCYNRVDGSKHYPYKRWLHTQESRASQAPQMQDEDVIEGHEELNEASDAILESDLIIEHNNETSTVKGKKRVDDIKDNLKNISRVTDQLLRLVGKLLPSAQPLIQIQSLDHQESKEHGRDSQCTLCIRFANEEYGIKCEHNCEATKLSQASIKTVFEELARKYITQLLSDNAASERIEHGIESYSTQKMLDLLDLEPISIDHSSINFEEAHSEDVRVHRTQAYSGYEALGQPQIWPDPILAERLARYSAYADLLQRVKESGCDLTPLKQTKTIKPANTKKKRSLELERVDYNGQPWVYDASISQECLSAMVYTLQQLRSKGLPDTVELQPLRTRPEPARYTNTYPFQLRAISRELKKQLRTENIDPHLRMLREQRDKLPIRIPHTANKIYDMIHQNDVFVLVAETGSGKTTQLPQILLEKAIMAGTGAWCNVMCTQPRRIAATSVAARVAKERGTYVGGSVGYQIRFDHRAPHQSGSITYSTAGVLLKKLQVDSEAVLSQTSHIVVDEIHERDLTVDLLLAFLRDLIRTRRAKGEASPKIILMSATMKALEFEKYFAQPFESFTPKVASMSVPGRAYPVTTHMLDDLVPMMVDKYARNMSIVSLLRESREYLSWEDQFAAEQERLKRSMSKNQPTDYNTDQVHHNSSPSADPLRDEVIPNSLITALVGHILRDDEAGDILVFLPGMREMDALANTLLARQPLGLRFDDRDKIRVFKLHSAFHDTNYEVFEPIPEGCRRVILATNIAQTSITLPEVVHVIDAGKRREMVYDQVTRQNEFGPRWIDQSTSFQRKGRAGRTKPGHYWAMFTKARFETLSEKAKPEILISDLTSSSLILKSYSDDIDLRVFFARTLDPPDPSTAEACIKELKGMQMLTADEKITPLGKFCSDFPLHPAKARGLLMGLLFKCFQPLMIVACHDLNSPLVHSPTNRRDMYYAALSFASVADDDRYVFVKAFSEFEDAHRRSSVDDVDDLERKSVKREVYQTMSSVGYQLTNILSEYGFLPRMRDALVPGQVQPSAFQNIPPILDRNSHRLNLFKALSLTVDNSNVAVWHDEEQAWLVKDLKCMLRPYSVNTMQSLKLLDRAPFRKTGEIVCYSEMVRNIQSSTRPFLVESSSISPLLAMLFGGPIKLIDNNIIEINGWLRYRMTVAVDETNHDQQGNVYVAAVILEFRKAIDRFLTLAFSNVRNVDRSRMPERLKRNYNNFFWPTNLRDIMTEGLLSVLDADAQHWDEIIQQPRSHTTNEGDRLPQPK